MGRHVHGPDRFVAHVFGGLPGHQQPVCGEQTALRCGQSAAVPRPPPHRLPPDAGRQSACVPWQRDPGTENQGRPGRDRQTGRPRGGDRPAEDRDGPELRAHRRPARQRRLAVVVDAARGVRGRISRTVSRSLSSPTDSRRCAASAPTTRRKAPPSAPVSMRTRSRGWPANSPRRQRLPRTAAPGPAWGTTARWSASCSTCSRWSPETWTGRAAR